MIDNIKPSDIVCYHIGGYGDYSHINIIGDRFPSHTVYVAFEAREDDEDLSVKDQYIGKGIRTALVRECISDKKAVAPFYINVMPASSSIFQASPEAQSEHMPDQTTMPMWGDHATTARIVQLQTHTIDGLINERHLPPPDLLSIDAQGAELKIMNGASNALDKDILGILTEVEFHEIYKGQPLFSDQFNLLYGHGFRLAEILAQQYWHPVARIGDGLLTVGEALFLRSPEKYAARMADSLTAHKMIKLAAISFAFRRLSLAIQAIDIALEQFGSEAVTIIQENPQYTEMLALRNFVRSNMDQYKKDAYFFEKHSAIVRRYGPAQDIGRRAFPGYEYIKSY